MILYGIAHGLVFLVSFLPFRLLYGISDLTCFLIYHIAGYRKKVVLENLTRAFPEKPEDEIRRICKNFYRNFSDIIVETVKMRTISGSELKRRCTLKNSELIETYFQDKKSLVMVFGHYCNWEWALMSMAVYAPHKTFGVYKPLSSKAFNRLMLSIRSRNSVIPVPMKNTIRTILEHRNEPTIAELISDQSPTYAESDYWTTFLNQETLVFLGAERIAKKTGDPVVFVKVQRIARGRYELELVPVTDAPKSTGEYEITNKHVGLLEEMIRERPENWLWSHRRWKRQKK